MARTNIATKQGQEEQFDETTSFDQQPEAKDSSASKRRKEQLTQDNDTYIEIPDVSDIPGQEQITNAGVPAAMGDTTASSDDEEGIRDGRDILGGESEDSELNIVMGTSADVTEEDMTMLGDRDQDMDMSEDELVRKEGLDDTDFDGDPLNEAAVSDDSTGEDLDMPYSGDEDARKELDDEENDYYSLGSGDKDALNEGRRDD